MDAVGRIFELAQQAVHRFDVFKPRGQGGGNNMTNEAMSCLNDLVQKEYGQNVIQQVLCNDNRQSVDFYLEAERTVIKVEFSLSNPYPSLEKDLFKVLLAKDSGKQIDKPVLIGDPSSNNKHLRPAMRSIISWAKRHYDLEIVVFELKANV